MQGRGMVFSMDMGLSFGTGKQYIWVTGIVVGIISLVCLSYAIDL